MKKIKLGIRPLKVDDRFADFTIAQKPSSNVAFFGTKTLTHELFVQFKNGSCYIYHEVDDESLTQIHTAESVGKFISGVISKKFPCIRFHEMIIIDDLETEV